MTITVLNIDTPSLGDRSYVVHDGKTAVIIDPQRDVDRLNDLLLSKNLQLGAVCETHMHNDYLSGGLELSKQHGAKYLINRDDPVKFDRTAVMDQQVIPVGSFALKVVRTPGHTFTHLAYELIGPENTTIGVFTGGSLLHGATGRPDLMGWENAKELAGLQHSSVRRLADSLGDEVDLYPTHGFGSFCSATPSLTDHSTIADEKKSNPALLSNLGDYIDSTLAALDIYPTYFNQMAPGNIKGPKNVDLSELSRRTTDEILKAIKSGSWVIDLRARTEWAAEHLPGTLSFGIDGSLASYLGWLYPYEKDLFILSDNAHNLALAQRELVRIGIDRPTGAFVGSVSNFGASATIRVAKFFELPKAAKNLEMTILDVRQVLEREKSHIAESVFIPFYEVEARVDELPTSGQIWVHCASGYRAATVIGFIEASGRVPVLINENYENALLVKELSFASSQKNE